MGKNSVALIVGSVALLVALVPTASVASRYRIKASADDTWVPDHVIVMPGDVVVWRNTDDRFHDLTSYGRNWSKERGLPPGEATSRRFRRTGIYKFRCRIHSAKKDGVCDGMCGSIRVQR